MNKQELTQALQDLYQATTLANLNKQQHDLLLKNAQEILKFIEEVEVKEKKVEKETKKK